MTIKGDPLYMDTYFHIFVDTLFGFFAMFLLMKVLGKTQMSALTPFDFIAAIILGELVGNALFDKKAGITEIAFVIFLWGGLLYAVEIISQKFKRTRYIIEGKPSLVIHQGMLIREEMRKNKIDINEVQQLLRDKDVFSIQEVEYGILESNGKISVLKKSAYQTPNKKDLNVAPTDVVLPYAVIIDGEIVTDNLKEAGLHKNWLLDELRRQGYEKIEDVYFAEYAKDKKLFILPFTEIPKRKSD